MKTYFIDTENVGRSWIDYVKENPENKYILFHTENSPAVPLSKVPELFKVMDCLEFIQCYTGSNALDFQLSSYLGFVIASNRDDNNEYYLYSRDCGYDPMIKFWGKRGISIKRVQNLESDSQEDDPILDTPIYRSSMRGLENQYASSFEDDDYIYSRRKKTNGYSKDYSEKPSLPKKKSRSIENQQTQLNAITDHFLVISHGVTVPEAAKAETARIVFNFLHCSKNCRMDKVHTEMTNIYGQKLGDKYYKYLRKQIKDLFLNYSF